MKTRYVFKKRSKWDFIPIKAYTFHLHKSTLTIGWQLICGELTKIPSFPIKFKLYPMPTPRVFCLLAATLFLFISCSEELQRPVFEYTFTNPAAVGSRYPNLYTDSTGVVYMSWTIGIEEDIYALQYSRLIEGRWTEPETVAVNTEFFVNWADFPSVVGQNNEATAAHWLRKIEGGLYAYNVQVSLRGENGDRWSQTVTPHDDGAPVEHGFVSMEPLENGNTLVIWLDGRETEERADDEYSDISMAMTLRSAEITPEGDVVRSRLVDPTVCDCCPTDLVRSGEDVYAVYRNRTGEEIRDIYQAKYNTAAGEWDTPSAVAEDGWQISACPVNGPRIEADGDRLAVAWFTGVEDTSRVKLAISTNGGDSFNAPEIIAEGNNLGRADVLLKDDGTVYVSWLGNREGLGEVMLQKINPDGTRELPFRVGVTDISRSSGFPRMADAGEFILVAWTQTDPNLNVRTARVPFSQ
jgi:hypothetical protein